MNLQEIYRYGTEADVISAIQRRHAAGRSLQITAVTHDDSALVNAAKRCFGDGWPEALDAAGLGDPIRTEMRRHPPLRPVPCFGPGADRLTAARQSGIVHTFVEDERYSWQTAESRPQFTWFADGAGFGRDGRSLSTVRQDWPWAGLFVPASESEALMADIIRWTAQAGFCWPLLRMLRVKRRMAVESLDGIQAAIGKSEDLRNIAFQARAARLAADAQVRQLSPYDQEAARLLGESGYPVALGGDVPLSPYVRCGWCGEVATEVFRIRQDPDTESNTGYVDWYCRRCALPWRGRRLDVSRYEPNGLQETLVQSVRQLRRDLMKAERAFWDHSWPMSEEKRLRAEQDLVLGIAEHDWLLAVCRQQKWILPGSPWVLSTPAQRSARREVLLSQYQADRVVQLSSRTNWVAVDADGATVPVPDGALESLRRAAGNHRTGQDRNQLFPLALEPSAWWALHHLAAEVHTGDEVERRWWKWVTKQTATGAAKFPCRLVTADSAEPGPRFGEHTEVKVPAVRHKVTARQEQVTGRVKRTIGVTTLDQHLLRHIERLVRAHPGVTAVSQRSEEWRQGEKVKVDTVQVADAQTYRPVVSLKIYSDQGFVHEAILSWPRYNDMCVPVANDFQSALPILCHIEAAIFRHVDDYLDLGDWLEEEWGMAAVLDYEEVAPGELYLVYLDGDRNVAAAVAFGTDGVDIVTWKRVLNEGNGPSGSRCPRRLLERLTPTENEVALVWRERCWEWVTEQEAILKQET